MYLERISRRSHCIPLLAEPHIIINYSPIINEISNCSNVINSSPNAKMNVSNGCGNLTKQEIELLSIYREFTIQEQAKFIEYMFRIKATKL